MRIGVVKPLAGLALLWAVVLLTANIAPAADTCKGASASTIERSNGVIVQRVTLSGPWGDNHATAFLPDKEVADGGIVFSHSAIRSNTGTTGMLPMALTLARAGAAVIVPDRTITWPPTEQSMDREGPIEFCAEQWLIANVAFKSTEPTIANGIVVRDSFAYVGPRLCGRSSGTECGTFTSPFAKPYHRAVWVPVAETEGGDSTDQIVSDGGLRAAQWVQRHLGLAPIHSIVGVPVSSRQ